MYISYIYIEREREGERERDPHTCPRRQQRESRRPGRQPSPGGTGLSPESEKWELMAEAPSTKLCFCIRLVTALQCIPFPGPPDEKAWADPKSWFMT